MTLLKNTRPTGDAMAENKKARIHWGVRASVRGGRRVCLHVSWSRTVLAILIPAQPWLHAASRKARPSRVAGQIADGCGGQYHDEFQLN